MPVAASVNGAPFTGIATILGEVSGSAPRIVTIIDPYAEPAGQGKSFLRVPRCAPSLSIVVADAQRNL